MQQTNAKKKKGTAMSSNVAHFPMRPVKASPSVVNQHINPVAPDKL